MVQELQGLGLLATAEAPVPRLFSPADLSKLPYLTCVIKVLWPVLKASVCTTGVHVLRGQPQEPLGMLRCPSWQHAFTGMLMHCLPDELCAHMVRVRACSRAGAQSMECSW